jgi:hypothetical protein
VRVKGYLTARGVEFVAIDISSDESALVELQAQNLQAVPVVAVGERYALGLDLRAIDELLGRSNEGAPTFSATELGLRASRLLERAVGFVRQLPASEHDHIIPGMESVGGSVTLPDGTTLVLADGRPYVPHRTYLGLFRHVIAHAHKFAAIAARPQNDYTRVSTFAPFGEPLESTPVEALVAEASELVQTLRDPASRASDLELDSVINTYSGPQTARDLLQSNVYSLAQHTRQLQDVLHLLDIGPRVPVEAELYSGLELPERVWD